MSPPGKPPPAPSPGLALVVRSMEGDVLAPEQMLREAAAAFRQEGAAGSRSLAGLLRELTDSRSRHVHHALFVAELLEPTPELLAALQAVLAAPPVRQGGHGSFSPEITGGGRVGWTDGTHRRLQDLAQETLVKLQAAGRLASPPPPALPGPRIAGLFARHFNGFTASSEPGLTLQPDASRTDIRRARATFALFDEGESVLAFIDNTVLLTGDEGLVVTDRRIFFTAAPPAKKHQGRDFRDLGYSVADGPILKLEDKTEIVLVADPAVVEKLARFLNDAHDAAVEASGGRVVATPAGLRPEEAAHYARCWFCEKEQPAVGLELTAELHRTARQRDRDDRNAFELQTDTASLKVPRCRACAASHTRREKLEGYFIGAAFLLFAGLWAALAALGYPKAGFVLGAFLGLGLGGYLTEVVAKSRRFLLAGVKAEIEKVDFPPALRLESEGWTQTERKENFYTQAATDWENETKSK